MTLILKNRLNTLYCDESGVALAFSVVVFLFLYLFGMGIYAVGDTVQKRIKLQNAVDAAAYSGAVVQADTLSRIAVINKAMSWTYVMQTRMQMDYIVHKWLGNVIRTWDTMDLIVRTINSPSCCANRVPGTHYTAGEMTPGGHGIITLQPSACKVSVPLQVKTTYNALFSAHISGQLLKSASSELANSALDGVNNVFNSFADDVTQIVEDNKYKKRRKTRFRTSEAKQQLSNLASNLYNTAAAFIDGGAETNGVGSLLGKQIGQAQNNIKAMNNAVTELKNSMKEKITVAIDDTLTENYPDAAYSYLVHDASKYLYQLKANDERHFLDFAKEFRGKKVTSVEIFNKGANKWMNLTGGDIQRGYGVDCLIATWINYSSVWVHPLFSCIGCPVPMPPSVVTAGTFRDSYYTGEAAKPLVLTKKYFQPEGAIVIAASVPLNNPFASWGDVSKGLFSAFTVGGGGQKIVAVSAARAGYCDHYEGWATGEYMNHRAKPENIKGNYIGESWNLCEADWDAAFIPINDTTTISASDFKKLIESVGSKDFVPKKDSNKNTKINYQEAVKHVTH